MVHNDVNLLRFAVAHEIARHTELQTRLDLASVGIVRFEFKAVCLGGLEEHGVVEESHIPSTAVRSFYQNRFEATSVFAICLCTEIVQATYILHLRYTDTCCTAWIIIGSELRNGISHILHLVLILESIPLHTTVRQVLVVILTLIMDGIEKVLQVVERDTTNELRVRSLLCFRKDANRQHQCCNINKCVFHCMYFCDIYKIGYKISKIF